MPPTIRPPRAAASLMTLAPLIPTEYPLRAPASILRAVLSSITWLLRNQSSPSALSSRPTPAAMG